MIALIAHDRKKPELVAFVRRHVDFFREVTLIATASTGALLHHELGLHIERVPHGPQGGDLTIAAKIVEGIVKAVIFFRDPLTAQPHEPDVTALLRVCDVHDVPLATNRGAADMLITGLKLRDEAE